MARISAWNKAHPENGKARGERHRARHPQAARDYKVWAKYGLTAEAVHQMFENQEGLCAICSKLMYLIGPHGDAKACIDHDHVSERVRGLLCNSCNAGIGQLKDSMLLLQNAIGYLEVA